MKTTPYWVTLLLFVFTSAFATQEAFEEGKQYQRASKEVTEHQIVQGLAQKAKEENKVQVYEFFSYGCTWCFKLDPVLEKWSKKAPKHVQFERIPVEFQPAWHTLCKAYYTAEELKAVDKVHHALFDAIYNERVTDSSEATLQKFFVGRGVKAEAFKKTFASDEVASKQKWAHTVSKAYRITAIPAVIVQGSEGTFVTTVSSAGSEKELVKVVDYLTKMQKKS